MTKKLRSRIGSYLACYFRIAAWRHFSQTSHTLRPEGLLPMIVRMSENRSEACWIEMLGHLVQGAENAQ
jgi:hypothetical protein